MFNGAHVVVYTKDADADRDFFKDVLGFNHVDAGHGWLIFALPPAEVACHPAETGGSHELYLMCDDIEETRGQLRNKGVVVGEVVDEGWGLLSSLTLPGGGTVGFYQPRHGRP